LPKSLKKLKCAGGITDDNISQLPPGLLSLSFKCDESFSDIGIACLPRSLTSLRMKNAMGITNQFSSLLSPHLTYLDIEGFTQLTEECIGQLPKSLKKLKMKSNRNHLLVTNSNVSELPPTLLSLKLIDCVCLDNEKMGDLPRSLTSLELRGISNLNDDCIGWLPPNLRFLKARIDITDKGIRELPQTLRILDLRSLDYRDNWTPYDHVTDEGLKHLPPCLSQLFLTGSTSIQGKGFIALPRDMKVFSLDKATKVQDEYIKDLPRYLKILALPRATSLTATCVEDLPRSLISLNISHANVITNTSSILLSPNLIELTIDKSVDVKAVESFPKTLQKLYLLLNKNRIRDFSSLPMLEDISLYTISHGKKRALEYAGISVNTRVPPPISATSNHHYKPFFGKIKREDWEPFK
jgi:hypothetical protein